MTKKKVNFKRLPIGRASSTDAWVKGARTATKRFSFDVPVEMHHRIKLACVERGQSMVAEIITILNNEFPEAKGVRK